MSPTGAANTMTFREMTLRVFQGKPNPHVLFQPRFEPWFDWHRQFDSLPAECQGGKTVEQVYDQIGCSMRYIHYYTGQPSPIEQEFTADVKFQMRQSSPTRRTTVFDTPFGQLSESQEMTVDRVWRTTDYPGKSTADLPALLWLRQRFVTRFSPQNFKQGDTYIGARGVPQFWVMKSPYMALCQQWMNFDAFMYALADAPRQMSDLMQAIDDSYDAMFEQIVASGLPRIINFGDNIAVAHLSPRYFEQYLMPWYEKRVGQLKKAGIFTTIHIDGYFKPLIKQVRQLPHDGLEALTPKPQGDVTLEDMAEALGGKVLLDGIPAVLFLNHHPRQQLQECVERLVELFGPRLILGISDELPEGAGDEGFERLKWVAGWARAQVREPATEHEPAPRRSTQAVKMGAG